MRHLRTRVTSLALVAGLGILGVACADDDDPTDVDVTDVDVTDMTEAPVETTSPAMTESPTG